MNSTAFVSPSAAAATQPVLAPVRRLARRRWLVLIIELAWVVLFSLYVGREFLDFDPAMRIHGRETEWITGPMAWTAQVWQQDGYIPRWMPLISRGQPAVDHGHSMLFNPVASVPSLLFGINTGAKLSVVLFLMLGGAGGLALGYTMGWGLPARVLLAGLLIARGSTLATFGFGYIQTAAQQMYFPWIMAGILGLAKGRQARVFVALIALSLSQTFLAGNVYHILPAAVMAGILVLMLSVRFTPRLVMDGLLMRRAALAFALAAGLMAVSALSTLTLYEYVRGRDQYFPVQTQELSLALQQFFVPDFLMRTGVEENNRYVFATPWWFALLLFVFLPPIPRLLYRSRAWWMDSRLWIFLVAGFLFFVAMGVGVNPITTWLWNTVETLRQWRFLERMLGVAGFFLVVLVALRFDGLWYALQSHWARSRGRAWVAALRKAALAGLAVCAVAVPIWMEENRTLRYALNELDPLLPSCLAALAPSPPGQLVAVDTSLYVSIWPYFESGVRLASFQADYDHRGRSSTLFNGELTQFDAPYYLPYGDPTDLLIAAGYRPVDRAGRCDWPDPILHNPNAVPYAFSAPVRVFETNDVAQVAAAAAPVEIALFEPERTVLRAENPTAEPIAVVVQTIAYPGWEARLNGQPVRLESVGELQGVILPAGAPSSWVEFVYIPTTFIIGGWITIATSVILAGYLLRVDEHVSNGWRRRKAGTQQTTTPAQEATYIVTLSAAEAVPASFPTIPAEEYPYRWAAAQRLMAAHGLDLLLAYADDRATFGAAHARWFADFPVHFEPCLVLLRPEGSPVLLTGPESDEYARLRGRIADVRVLREFTHPDEDYPYSRIHGLADILAETADLSRIRRVGVGGLGLMSAALFAALQAALPEAEWIDSEAALCELRSVKSPAELAVTRRAYQIAEAGLAAGVAAIAPGVSERAVAAEIEAALRHAGAEGTGIDTIVAAGPHSRPILARSTLRPLAAGDLVLLTVAPRYEGYHAAIGRPVFLGQPPAEVQRAFDAACRAQDACAAALRPGIEGRAVERIGRQIIEEAGLGEFFLYSGVHSVGVIEFEPPIFGPSSPAVLREGMIISVDIPLFNTPWGGLRIEDGYLITSNGAERLHATPYVLRPGRG